MRFAYPLLLLLIPAFAAGGIALFRLARKRAARKLAKFSPPSRLPNILRSLDQRARMRKAIMFTVALCLLALAIARPLRGPRSESTEQSGAEFFIVLDVSKSMLARDVAPNRLEAVKASLADWLKTRRGDRIGLILMAGDAFVQAPLTNDYTALREVLAQSSPASISLGGTNIPAALKVALKALETGSVKNKAIVLVSDGENLEGNIGTELEQARQAQKVHIFTVGVGTLEGAKVPEKESNPDFSKPPKGYVRDDYGVTAHSRLDERNLRAIATAGDGRYFSFAPGGEVWDALYTQALAPLARRADTFNLQQYDELFQIPLFLALILLGLEMGISTRHKNPARPRSIVSLPEPAAAPTASHMPPTKPTRSRVPVATMLVLASCVTVAQAVSPTTLIIEQSEALMKAGKAGEAAATLRAAAQKNPDDYFLVYNLGIASYAAGQFQDAIDSFSEATMSPDKKIRAQALYQMGNAQFQLGKTLIKSANRTGASVALERAVESYESALSVKSTSATENNLKVAKERLETVLMDLANSYLANAQKATQPPSRIAELTKAVSTLERVTQIAPKNTDAAQKLEKARKELSEQLRDQARTQRTAAEQLTDPKKEKEQEKLNVAANDSYQQARDNNPADKELEREHEEFKKNIANALAAKAEEKMQQAAQPTEKDTMADVKKRQNTLTEALGKAEKALAFDEKNTRAQNVKNEAMKKLEEAHMEYADMAKAAGDKQAQTQPDAAAGNFTEAMQNYQKALGINPENARAKEQLAKVEESLAKALTETGKKEMAQAAGEQKPTGKGKPQAPPTPQDPAAQSNAQLRENIGHLEKAAQSFAQADALSPGENGAKDLQAQAMSKLGELRAALDQAQNKGPNGGQEPKPPGEPVASNEPSTEPGEMPGKGPVSPTKPVLSFSEIRGADKSEGLFKDLRQKSKIRDW